MKQSHQPSLRPRISSAKRMAADPSDWSGFKVGDAIGVFLGNCWRKALILEMANDHVVIEGKHLGTTQVSTFNVYDARNIVHAAELRIVHFQEETLFDHL